VDDGKHERRPWICDSASASGQKNHFAEQRLMMFTKVPKNGQTAVVRHHQVEQQYVVAVAVVQDSGHYGAAVPEELDLDAKRAQQLDDQPLHRRVVFEKKDAGPAKGPEPRYAFQEL
jgi:hypothetical protein